MTQGGRRPGSGRKTKTDDERLHPVFVGLSLAERAWVRAQGPASAVIRRLVQRAMREPKQ